VEVLHALRTPDRLLEATQPGASSQPMSARVLH
jgi:hypothetical protein